MRQLDVDDVASCFYKQLTDEVTVLSEQLNQTNSGDLQDGISMQHIDDGWISYKGMSWGFVLKKNPTCISMTFGPDWPFVGYCQNLQPEICGDRIVWIDEQENKQFNSPLELARYGLESLAAKVHDSFIVD